MHEAVVSGGCVLVHCNAGVSRAATVVAAYLIRHHAMTTSEALNFIKVKRPFIRPNPGFMEQLKEYEARLSQVWRFLGDVFALYVIMSLQGLKPYIYIQLNATQT